MVATRQNIIEARDPGSLLQRQGVLLFLKRHAVTPAATRGERPQTGIGL